MRMRFRIMRNGEIQMQRGFQELFGVEISSLQDLPTEQGSPELKNLELEVLALVERFGRRGTEPNELFRSEFGQNSWNRKKTTKNHFIEVACDPKYKKGPEKRETNCLEAARRTTLSHQFK